MRRLSLVLATGMLCCFCATVSADIYVWTDDNGVKHFTNSVPPAGTEILMQTEEIPHDEKAHKDRMEVEQLEKVIAARQEVADMEAQLIEMQRVAERRLEEANRKAREALEYAQSLMTETQENYSGFTGRRIRYFGHYPYYNNFKQPHYKRWYYPEKGNIYNKSPHYDYNKSHYKKQSDNYYGKRRNSRPHQSTKINNNKGYRSRFNGYRSRGSGSRYGRLN